MTRKSQWLCIQTLCVGDVDEQMTSVYHPWVHTSSGGLPWKSERPERYPIRGVFLRGKSKLVTEEKSMGYCNLAMGEVCGAQSINANDQVHKALRRKMCLSFPDSREMCHIDAWNRIQTDANTQRQKILAEAAAAIRLYDFCFRKWKIIMMKRMTSQT